MEESWDLTPLRKNQCFIGHQNEGWSEKGRKRQGAVSRERERDRERQREERERETERERQREERERERETRVVATEEHSRGVFSFFELMGKLASRWVRGRKGGSVSPGAIPAAL